MKVRLVREREIVDIEDVRLFAITEDVFESHGGENRFICLKDGWEVSGEAWELNPPIGPTVGCHVVMGLEDSRIYDISFFNPKSKIYKFSASLGERNEKLLRVTTLISDLEFARVYARKIRLRVLEKLRVDPTRKTFDDVFQGD